MKNIKLIFLVFIAFFICFLGRDAYSMTIEEFKQQTQFTEGIYRLSGIKELPERCENVAEYEIVEKGDELVLRSQPLLQFIVSGIGSKKPQVTPDGNCNYETKTSINGNIISSENKMDCKEARNGVKVVIEKIRMTITKSKISYTLRLFHDGKEVNSSVCDMELDDSSDQEPIIPSEEES